MHIPPLTLSTYDLLGTTHGQASWLAQVGRGVLIGLESMSLNKQACKTRRLLACSQEATDSTPVKKSAINTRLLQCHTVQKGYYAYKLGRSNFLHTHSGLWGWKIVRLPLSRLKKPSLLRLLKILLAVSAYLLTLSFLLRNKSIAAPPSWGWILNNWGSIGWAKWHTSHVLFTSVDQPMGKRPVNTTITNDSKDGHLEW